MRELLKKITRTVLILLLIGCVVGAFLYQTAQTGPEFYQQAMQTDATASSEAGELLEKKIVDLHNELVTQDRWSVTFTEAQLNGWLASGMPKRFAHMLPKSVSDPRISIVGDGMQIAFRYQGKRITGIITIHLDAIVGRPEASVASVESSLETDAEDGNNPLPGIAPDASAKPDEIAQADDGSTQSQNSGNNSITEPDSPRAGENQIGIVIRGVNAGVVPLPISPWKDRITKSAAKSNLPLEWSEMDGQTVAWTTVDIHLPDQPTRELKIENISFSEGLLHISGTADGQLSSQSSANGVAVNLVNRIIIR